MNWVYMIFQLLCKGIYDTYNFARVYMIFCKFVGVYMKLPLKTINRGANTSGAIQ
ncbi:hypothetical protein HanRHA438_Chr17g0799661 [Helianthus annuus]|nr:hypothetical protein HanRHA438_Chr17g0799661 [Helianthus annuus]